MANINFALTILFLVLLSISLASSVIGMLAPIAIAPVALCAYYVASLFVAASLNAKFPI